MKQTFSQFCAEIGVPLRNDRWSWSAVNDAKRQAIFTIWEDRLDQPRRSSIDLSWLNDPNRTENGAREFRRNMACVLDQGYEAFGILCEAHDPSASPRKRKRFNRELLALEVAFEAGRTIARIKGKVPPATITRDVSVADLMLEGDSAIDDIEDSEIGNPDPEYRIRLSGAFVRDNAVRNAVLKRARERCEHCGKLGFLKVDGGRYLEAHHVISLQEQGADTMRNVIALCANDHRRAHFGNDWKELQDQFLAKIQSF